MEVKFKRRLINELLTTYLPSFLLLGICYATTHFKSFYFEAAVTVNLTVMLVSTTLFIRWIISCLIYTVCTYSVYGCLLFCRSPLGAGVALAGVAHTDR